ncbi:hypothetical protein [Burkholderia sp. SIMBA_062]|uniref:hypothetical protein n=1 Tax=Burkholderia sp. SIMBA_062 TaxID=3085803 RepID=UPI00397CDD91
MMSAAASGRRIESFQVDRAAGSWYVPMSAGGARQAAYPGNIIWANSSSDVMDPTERIGNLTALYAGRDRLLRRARLCARRHAGVDLDKGMRGCADSPDTVRRPPIRMTDAIGNVA